ncbi:TPA: nuclear transport factor 2 family protein [Photobacterium damselae]
MIENITNTTVAKFVDIYSQLDKDKLDLINELYDHDVVFEDPAHRIEGQQELFDYFVSLYSNISSCTFLIHNVIEHDDEACLQWTMVYSHPKIEKGEIRNLDGMSYIRIAQDKVIYHRDYFDLGAMVYEGLPLLGKVIKTVKGRLGQ